MAAILIRICRYPVKGLTAETLEQVALRPGQRLGGDRRYAIANGGEADLEAVADWRPRNAFLMLARNERLALLEASFDEASGLLTLSRGGKQLTCGNLAEPLGRTLIEQFIGAFMKAELRGRPRVVEAREGGFTDKSEGWISLLNLASVRDLERVVRAPVDPRRFRANLHIDGVEPWRELDWVGRELRIGAARFRVAERIACCAATNVDPATAERNLNIPLALREGIGHGDMGVYLEALEPAVMGVGDALLAPAAPG
jgi:uncharacterized protein